MAAPRTNSAWQRTWPTLATFVLVVLVVACLYVARPVLIPLAVAILVTFILGPIVTVLQRRRVPRIPAVFLVVMLAGALVTSAFWLVGSQVVQLVAELPSYQDNVAKRIAEVRERGSGTLLDNVQQFIHAVTEAATTSPTEPAPPRPEEALNVRVVEQTAATTLATWLKRLQPVAEPFLTTGLVIVLVVYLLIFREDLRSRVLVLMGRGHLTLTTKALDDAGRRISRYLIAQFGLNVGFGIVIGLGLIAIGVPHAPLWGFAAGLLRYIPYLGPWMAATLPVSMSLLVSQSWVQPALVIGLFMVAEFSSNLVIEPWVYGQSIGVSQAAIIMAIVFWTWLWGAAGMVLGAPLTVCLVVIGKYVPALKFFDVLLGDEPVMTPDLSVYQRLLARDEDEAAELVRHHAQTESPLVVCDRILVPALAHARQDLIAGMISGEEYEYVHAAVRSIADQQDFAAAMAVQRKEQLDSAPHRQPLTVIACPAQDGAETAALALFQQMLAPSELRFEAVTVKHLVAEIVELVQQHQPSVVCIASLPPGGLAHTRHLCKRLRSRLPQQKIIVGRWGGGPLTDDREQWTNCGADYVGATFLETIKHLADVSQFLRPPASAVPAPHVTSLATENPATLGQTPSGSFRGAD